MPDFQDDDLALIGGKSLQARHGRRLGLGVVTVNLKPGLGLPFAGQSAPEAAPIIDCPISDRAHQVMLRAFGRISEGHQGDKNLLNHVLGLPIPKPQSAPVQNQFARLRRIKGGAPVAS